MFTFQNIDEGNHWDFRLIRQSRVFILFNMLMSDL